MLVSLLFVLPIAIVLLVIRRRRRQPRLVPLGLLLVGLAFIAVQAWLYASLFKTAALEPDPSMKATILAKGIDANSGVERTETLLALALLPVAWGADRWLRARAQR
jgi:hypothetical protein